MPTASAIPDASYLVAALEPEVARGEAYLLGQLYAGLVTAWQMTDTLALSLATIVNAGDPSVSFTPLLGWRLADELDLSFGAFLTYGERPQALGSGIPFLALTSEFGASPNLYFVQMVGYW